MRSDLVLKIVQDSNVKVSESASITTKFFLAPKTNFAGGVPQRLQEFVVSEEEIRRNYQLAADSDFSAVVIFDSSTPRELMGKRTSEVAFTEKTGTQAKIRRVDLADEAAFALRSEPASSASAPEAAPAPGALLDPHRTTKSAKGALKVF